MERIFLKRNEARELSMRKMAEEILDKGLSPYSAQIRYSVKTALTVQKWVRKLQDERFALKEQHQTKNARTPAAIENLEKIIQADTAKIQQLEQQLHEANLKALYFEHLLRTSEQKLGIQLEKNSVTR
jgi:transposase-like protein